jgi:hypothetical protein
MTVKEAIELLSKMPDKTLKLMIDCPYCGKGNQVATISECVVLASKEESDVSRP